MHPSSISAYCITLNPNSQKRAIPTLENIKKLGFTNVQFAPGVRGGTLAPLYLKSILSPRAFIELQDGRYVHEALSGAGSVGCYLAHIKLWKHCVDKNDPIAIFEDDLVITEEAPAQITYLLNTVDLQNVDVIRLVHSGIHNLPEELEVLSEHLSKVKRTMCLAGYIMTPKAAKTLLSTAFPIDMHVDHYMDSACRYHNLNHLALTKSIHKPFVAGSEIGHNDLKEYSKTGAADILLFVMGLLLLYLIIREMLMIS